MIDFFPIVLFFSLHNPFDNDIQQISLLFRENQWENLFVCSITLLEKFTWLVTEKARDGKYPHSTGKFTDTMRVKDQIEYFYFSSFFFQNTMELDWI
jgi:hypothetical protein